jgi:hypothetical protein
MYVPPLESMARGPFSISGFAPRPFFFRTELHQKLVWETLTPNTP